MKKITLTSNGESKEEEAQHKKYFPLHYDILLLLFP